MREALTETIPIASPAIAPIDARRHLAMPLVLCALALASISLFALDWRIAHALYAWEGYRWILKHAFVTETLLHRLGHDLSLAAWLGVLLVWLTALRRDALAGWRRPLGYLLLSVLLSTLLVAALKSATGMDCPWDIDGLGGARPYLGLFDPRPTGLPDAACFPAGHASGGYAWMALYFFFRMTRPALRLYGLSIGATVGAVFGVAQQLRGAHFLSHDLWTAALCWAVAFGLFSLFHNRWRRSAKA
jgi:membrane-associated PAP2 superfamily phosphatase